MKEENIKQGEKVYNSIEITEGIIKNLINQE